MSYKSVTHDEMKWWRTRRVGYAHFVPVCICPVVSMGRAPSKELLTNICYKVVGFPALKSTCKCETIIDIEGTPTAKVLAVFYFRNW